MGIGVEVDCYCVDHFGWWGGGRLCRGGLNLRIVELEEMLVPRIG